MIIGPAKVCHKECILLRENHQCADSNIMKNADIFNSDGKKIGREQAWTDEFLEDTENLPDPDVLVKEIVEDMESAMMKFESIMDELGEDG